jgi:hypothetical protein
MKYKYKKKNIALLKAYLTKEDGKSKSTNRGTGAKDNSKKH